MRKITNLFITQVRVYDLSFVRPILNANYFRSQIEGGKGRCDGEGEV